MLARAGRSLDDIALMTYRGEAPSEVEGTQAADAIIDRSKTTAARYNRWVIYCREVIEKAGL